MSFMVTDVYSLQPPKNELNTYFMQINNAILKERI